LATVAPAWAALSTLVFGLGPFAQAVRKPGPAVPVMVRLIPAAWAPVCPVDTTIVESALRAVDVRVSSSRVNDCVSTECGGFAWAAM
jgi:hypothetical protein